MASHPDTRALSTGLTKGETRRSLNRFTWNTGFRAVFDIIGAGTSFVFVAFARTLGVEGEAMGWITTLISVACILQMAGVPIGRRFDNKKRFMLAVAMAEPLFFIAAVLGVLFLPGAIRLPVLGLAVFLSAASTHIARPYTDEWFASIIPAGIRGRYIGRRLQIYSGATILTTLTVGWLVDHVVGTDNARGLAVLLAIGGAGGFLAVAVLAGATVPAISQATVSTLKAFRGVLKTPGFMRFLAVVLCFNLPFNFACPYYQVFNLEVAHMPATMIALMQAGYFTMKILLLPTLGRWVDRWGAVRMLGFCGIAYTLFFAAFPFCGPGRYWPLMLAWTLVGAADASYNLASQILLYECVPQVPSRPAYFAIYNFTGMIAFAFGSALAVPALRAMKGLSVTWGPFSLGNFHLLYIGCMILMGATAFSVRGLSRAGRREVPSASGSRAAS